MLIREGFATAVHDVNDGGVLVAVTEMALAGNIGAHLVIDRFEDHVDLEVENHSASLFGETQGRYVIAEPFDVSTVEELARENDIGCCFIGWTGGDKIAIDRADRSNLCEISLADLRAAHEGFFPKLMGSDAALA